MAPYRPNRKKQRSKKNIMSENTNTESPAPELNLGDFTAMVQIIDLASERGTSKGAELSSVGTVRDRLHSFIAFHTPKDEEAVSEEATTEGEEATEETSE